MCVCVGSLFLPCIFLIFNFYLMIDFSEMTVRLKLYVFAIAIAIITRHVGASVDVDGSSTEDTFLRLDQAQTGRVTTFEIPSSGVWQSFTPGMNGNLTHVELFLGTLHATSSECSKFEGMLSIHRGEGLKVEPFFTKASRIHRQQYTITECRCNDADCMFWQSIQLTEPLPLEKDVTYSVYVSFPWSSPTTNSRSLRIGLSIADLYERGVNSFAAPGYDFSFKTYLRVSRSDAGEDVTFAPLDNENITPQDESNSNDVLAPVKGSYNNVYMWVGGVLAGSILVVIVILAARRASRQHRRILTDPTSEACKIPTSVNVSTFSHVGSLGDTRRRRQNAMPSSSSSSPKYVWGEQDSISDPFLATTTTTSSGGDFYLCAHDILGDKFQVPDIAELSYTFNNTEHLNGNFDDEEGDEFSDMVDHRSGEHNAQIEVEEIYVYDEDTSFSHV
eukprot:m.36944 g.36944  ORF g.36944 m.36944 type:complete len:446 (-) comp6709_c2_seq1:207-1544(-)